MLRQGVEAGEVRWSREPVLVGQSAVLVCLKDASPCQNDVAWEVNYEGDVALLEGVFEQEVGKVGAGEDCDLSACAVRVGSDGVFLVTFILCDEDVAKRCGAGSRGDAEDDVQSWGQLLGGIA